tara:strand:- start:85 stop:987 length:903 start_codon:yes stop_codon:yes gene_type:complete
VAVTVGVGTPGAMGNGNPSDGTICNFPACTVTELDLSNGVTGQPAPTPLFGNNGSILTPGSGSLNPGLEAFVDLEILKVNNQELASLDVSNNLALTYLDCGYQNLTNLNVSQNIALTYLDCAGNALQPLASGLDVSSNTALVELYCDYNHLTTLDVSNNTALTVLGCGDNQLTSIDVSNNTDLTVLNLTDNQLTSLDVSNNLLLEQLYPQINQLTTLDLSNNINLTHLGANYNYITDLYLGTQIDLANLFLHILYNPSTAPIPSPALVIHVGSAPRVLIAQNIPASSLWQLPPGTTFSPL